MSKMSPEATRLTLIDEDGVSSCYKIEPSITMRELLQFYCQRNKCLPDVVILRHEGRKILLSETPEKLGLPDLSVIDVETDYYKLYEDLRQTSATDRLHLHQQLQDEEMTRDQTDAQHAILAKECELLGRKNEQLEQQSRDLEVDNAEYRTVVQRLKTDLKSEREARRVAEGEQTRAEKELNGLDDRKERKLLEKTLKKSRIDLAKIPGLQADIQKIQNKNKALQEQVQHNNHVTASVRRDLNQKRAQRTKKTTALAAQVELLEKYEADAAAIKAELATYEAQAVEAAKEVARWKAKYRSCEKTAKDLTPLKNKVQQVEKETKELRKWQSVAKQHDKEIHDTKRWTKILQQNKVRELSLEKEVNELHAWRQRCIALDKDGHELQMWKRKVLQNLNNGYYPQQPYSSPRMSPPLSSPRISPPLSHQQPSQFGQHMGRLGPLTLPPSYRHRNTSRFPKPQSSHIHHNHQTSTSTSSIQNHGVPAKNLPIGGRTWSQSSCTSEFLGGGPLFMLGDRGNTPQLSNSSTPVSNNSAPLSDESDVASNSSQSRTQSRSSSFGDLFQNGRAESMSAPLSNSSAQSEDGHGGILEFPSHLVPSLVIIDDNKKVNKARSRSAMNDSISLSPSYSPSSTTFRLQDLDEASTESHPVFTSTSNSSASSSSVGSASPTNLSASPTGSDLEGEATLVVAPSAVAG